MVMEFGRLERQIHVDASPETVFEVLTQAEHIRQWWSDDAILDPAPGAVGEVIWGNREHVAEFTVVEIDAPRIFSFRWVAPDGEAVTPDNSLLVTFELEPVGSGTLLHMTEAGFREKGWEGAVLEEAFRDHSEAWDRFLPQLANHAASLSATR